MQNKDHSIKELEKTIQKYKKTVYGIAFTHLKNKQEADDVFQEVFLLYFQKDISFENEECKRAWLIKTTINKCRQSNHNLWNTIVDKKEEVNIAQTVDIASKEESDVYNAVLQLDVKYRTPLYLHYFIGMPIEEIGKIMKIRSNTISVRLNRAKKILRKRLERSEGMFYEN